MTASAHNGFMITSLSNCAGHPFTFHAEYSTARKQNMVPWTALETGVLMEQEIGHFETCNSLHYRDGFRLTGAGQSYLDPKVYQACVGGSEGRHHRGEGTRPRCGTWARSTRLASHTRRCSSRPTSVARSSCATRPPG
jgi:hypothetical protein